ncbi:MAG TPA: arginase family protein [Candidatus Limnocylindria bacterium]|nr:arginase family protein [Candidatus Limnocylindria bacterium]
MAAVPVHLLEAGVVTEQRFAALGGAPAALGPAVSERIRPDKKVRIPFVPRDRWLTAARESCRTLAEAVRSTMAAGAVPVVLGGECTVVAGSVSGALTVEPDLALVYFDAHGDFNTLATTPTHYVAGMCLAHVCGRKVAPLLWPGARTISDDRVALVGGRALDPGEAGNLQLSRVTRVAFDREHPDAPGLLAWARRKPLLIHVDIDVVDPAEVPAVVNPVPGGPRLRSLADILSALAAVATVRGVELCGYDPQRDEGARLAGPLADLVAAAAAKAAVPVAR